MSNKPLLESAADTTRSAATQAAHTIEQIAEALAPLIAAAIANAREHAAPYAATAREKVVPLTESARVKLTPFADSAREHVVPLAHQTIDRVTPLAGSAREYVGHAGEQIAPLASVARDRSAELVAHTRDSLEPAILDASAYIQDDLLPKLNDLLHQAAEHPTVSEATHRGQAALAALKGELSVPTPAELKSTSPAVRLAKILAVGAVVGGAIVAVRQMLASRDSGWTAHQPSAAYVNRDDEGDSTPQPAADVAEDAPEVEVEIEIDVEVPQGELHHGDSHAPVDEAEAQALMTDEGAPVAPTAEETTAETAVLSPYGEGAYVGDEPPEDYTIKGNERSMKYHVAASGGYERTIADVWFASEEAAIAAGFTRAQR